MSVYGVLVLGSDVDVDVVNEPVTSLTCLGQV